MVFIIATDVQTKQRVAIEMGGNAAAFERDGCVDYTPGVEGGGKFAVAESFDEFIGKITAAGITVAL